MHEIMKAKEVAEYLRLHYRVLLQKARKGDIPGAKIGNEWRFRRKDIEDWFESKMTNKNEKAAKSM